MLQAWRGQHLAMWLNTVKLLCLAALTWLSLAVSFVAIVCYFRLYNAGSEKPIGMIYMSYHTARLTARHYLSSPQHVNSYKLEIPLYRDYFLRW